MITKSSRLTFGKYRGHKLDECPMDYLRWMAANLKDTDFHEWATASAVFLKEIEKDQRVTGSLEEQADALLRAHGFGELANRRKRR